MIKNALSGSSGQVPATPIGKNFVLGNSMILCYGACTEFQGMLPRNGASCCTLGVLPYIMQLRHFFKRDIRLLFAWLA